VTYSTSQLAYRRRQLAYYAMRPAESAQGDGHDADEQRRLRAVMDEWAERNEHIVMGLRFFMAGVVAAVRERLRVALTAVTDAIAVVLSCARACIPWLGMLCVAVPVVAVLWALETREVGETVVHYELVPDVRSWSVCCCRRAG